MGRIGGICVVIDEARVSAMLVKVMPGSERGRGGGGDGDSVTGVKEEKQGEEVKVTWSG